MKLNNKSLFEIWHKREASIKHLKVFGTKTYVPIKQKRTKATESIHVGYNEDIKGYRI